MLTGRSIRCVCESRVNRHVRHHRIDANGIYGHDNAGGNPPCEDGSPATRIANGSMILFGERAFAAVGGSRGRVPVTCEQERVAAELHRFILHLPALISDVIVVR
jgi:hypothetical protein